MRLTRALQTLIIGIILTACGDGRMSPQGGTITSVNAGSGATGGGSAGAVTINVGATAGGGLEVGPDSIGIRTDCDPSEVPVWDGDSWECGAGGSTYTAGDGLTESPAGTFNVNLPGTGTPCPAGTAVDNIASDGTASCGASVGGSYTAGDGLTLTGSDFDVVPHASGGLSIVSDQVSLLQSCSSNQILKWGGSSWACAADANSALVTNGAIPKGNGTTQVASIMTESGGLIGVSGGVYATGVGTYDGNVTMGNATTDAHVLNGTLNANSTAGTSGQVLTINGSGLPQWAASASGADGLGADGDKGDFTVSGGAGNVATIDNSTITSAKILDNTIAFNDIAQINTARFVGRSTAGTGNLEVMSGATATALLSQFSTAGTTQGVVPGSNGATTSCLKGDGSWGTCGTGDITDVIVSPPLQGGGTSGSVSVGMSNGNWGDITTSTGGDDGDVWDINPGVVGSAELENDLDLSGNGKTTVGGFGGKPQEISTTGTITEVALNDDTAILRFTGVGSVSLRSIAGGWDGRWLWISNMSSATTYEHEQTTGTTATNRFSLANVTNWVSDAGSIDLLYYDGNAGRWRLYKNRSFALLNVTGSAGVGSLSVTGTATFNGNINFGNNAADNFTFDGHATGAALLIGRQIFTASGTYTPTSGTYKVMIELVGGGGGGGGSATTTSSYSCSGGGASGTYARKWIDPGAAITGGTVTIGALGAGGAAGVAGSAGTATSIVIQGNTFTARGGGGGSRMSAQTAASMAAGGVNDWVNGSLVGTGATDVDVHAGEPGGTGFVSAFGGTGGVSGAGGSNPLGGGGSSVATTSVGSSGSGFGAGGSGSCTLGASGLAGGDGLPGVVIVWEYR